jgi:archaemetzincin
VKSPKRLSRRELIGLAVLSTFGGITWSVRRLEFPRLNTSDESLIPLPDAENVERLRGLARTLHSLFAPMPAPEPGDWLAKHEELGQTFLEFVRSFPNMPNQRFRRLCVVQLGEFTENQERLLVDTGAYLERFFGYSVKMLESVSLHDLPASAERIRESGARQVRTSHFLNTVLPPLCGEETAAVFGLTAEDLWDGEFNFLYGQGSAGTRTCIGSVARFGDADEGEIGYATCLRRTIGLATHELGHVFHIPHCIAHLCRMNGSNHLAESDRRPLEFCPECLPKIWWFCGVDPAERFERLLDFAETHGLSEDAGLWRSAGSRIELAIRKAVR